MQDKWDINNRWNVTPGIRFDHNSQYGNHTSPSVTVGYKAGETTNYYISYKKFFRAPSLMQLYYPGGGNPNLDPEIGYTVELGLPIGLMIPFPEHSAYIASGQIIKLHG